MGEKADLYREAIRLEKQVQKDIEKEKSIYSEQLEKRRNSPFLQPSPLHEELANYIKKLDEDLLDMRREQIIIETKLYEIELIRDDIEKILNG